MIVNATLTNITEPPTPSPTGKVVYGVGTTVSIRVALLGLSRAQTIATDRRISESDGVMYMPASSMPSGLDLASRYHVTVALDGGSAIVYEVMKCTANAKAGGLSHYECFVKVVA